MIRTGVANIGYEERRRLNDEPKAAVARVCARAIHDNSSLFLNIGMTTEKVAREFAGKRVLPKMSSKVPLTRA